MSRPVDDASVWAMPGQRHVAEVLQAAAARDEVGHAWAFLGPRGVGQERAARALTAALNCPRPSAPGVPCGRCEVCGRCLRGAYAAYREFHPTGAGHRVDDVRGTWTPAATRSLAEGRWRVLRVCDADRMNEAAANAFLKSLEEPPAQTVWLLDVADPDELPDTILSRCRALRFSPWSRADVVAEAARRGITDPADQELVARMAAGSPMVIERLARPGGLEDLRRHRELLSRLRDDGPGYAVVAARELDAEVKRRTDELDELGREEAKALAASYGDQMPKAIEKQLEEQLTRRQREARVVVLQAALDDLCAWLRDCMVVARGGQGTGPDDLDRARADGEVLGEARLVAATDLVLATRERLETNVSPVLALEALFMELSALALGAAVPSGR